MRGWEGMRVMIVFSNGKIPRCARRVVEGEGGERGRERKDYLIRKGRGGVNGVSCDEEKLRFQEVRRY